jgi:hypothetical protein
MAEVFLWDMANITTTGPDPFAEGSSAPSGVIGNSTFRIDPTARLIRTVNDDRDTRFEETTSQDLIEPVTIDGRTFAPGEFISTEYSYVVRPVGSTNPADNISIVVTKIGWDDIVGITSIGQLQKGVDYQFIAVASNDPKVEYASLYVCFASGTAISVPGGCRPVEDLMPGDLVLTRDSGAQPLVWVGRRRLQFAASNAAQRPIQFTRGCLGDGLPHRDLVVSPQHRIMIRTPAEVFCPAKAFDCLTGARQMKGKRHVTYHALMCRRHHVIYAEGCPVESFYLGSVSQQILSPAERKAIAALDPDLVTNFGPLARRSLTLRDSKRLLQSHVLHHGGAAQPWQASEPASQGRSRSGTNQQDCPASCT